ncbi:shikimate kinase AroK [Sediminicurvatus halobius]|uniref:Shikimate kinase n=1 Tax=Sediminicurvatus halobius TaxID=2182432 RepID=A0A2U2N6W2_9GAMM|nr:shikimate kinase AroK [Spiribacter halobius]PWG64818.1 shikimate kinase AroK [Spiribacter halobius]UEX78329.1 shikimate kinase AroK [Spiribacter halobius]
MAQADRIFLVGPMGAGKSTVGRRLARQLGLRFVDLDQALESRTGVDIPRIFDIEGEAGFRRREAALLDELTREPGIVLATGGGAITTESNRQHLAGRGLVVYLRAPVEVQLARTRHSSRPLLKCADPYARLEGLLAERAPLYEGIADLVVDAAEGGPDRLARRIATLIEEAPLAREP